MNPAPVSKGTKLVAHGDFSPVHEFCLRRKPLKRARRDLKASGWGIFSPGGLRPHWYSPGVFLRRDAHICHLPVPEDTELAWLVTPVCPPGMYRAGGWRPFVMLLGGGRHYQLSAQGEQTASFWGVGLTSSGAHTWLLEPAPSHGAQYHLCL